MEALITIALVYLCTCMAADAEFQQLGGVELALQPDRAIMAAMWPLLVFALAYDGLLRMLFDD